MPVELKPETGFAEWDATVKDTGMESHGPMVKSRILRGSHDQGNAVKL
jgi:hypothetical protein